MARPPRPSRDLQVAGFHVKIEDAAIAFDSDEIRVWISRLDCEDNEVTAMLETLSIDERERADRFKFEKDRVRFVGAHGILRRLLGAYLDRAPVAVRFQYNQWGKPSLARGSGLDLRFNLSHSHELAVYGFALGCDLGVDVELVRADFATNEIAERFFAPGEIDALRALPAELRAEGFSNCWTRKEAYVKALGEGLSIDLSSFEVSLKPGEPPRLIRGADPAGWTFASLRPGDDFVVAVAAHGASLRIAPLRWL